MSHGTSAQRSGLVQAGRRVAEIAVQLGVSGQTMYKLRNQDLANRGVGRGVVTVESVPLAAPCRQIRELEQEN